MGYYKNLMIDLMNEERQRNPDAATGELDDFTAGMQADDWSRITGSGLPLPGPEEYKNEVIPF